MAIASYAYGSVEGVAVQARRFTNAASTFDDSTYPTYEQIETWLNQVSAILNTVLNTHNITTPITDTELLEMMKLFVDSEVAAMVNGVNGAGRLGPTSNTVKDVGMHSAVQYDVQNFVSSNVLGFERMGATRTSTTAEILSRQYDEDGNETFPIFSRDSLGGETFVKGN